MTREEAIKIVQSATVWTDEERDALAMLIPELAESEDENLKNKSGYYKAGKFWKASTLWKAVKDKTPQKVPNRYIMQECTWNISTLQNFADEVKNVQEVELAYPIILDINGNILDGAHRVVKAYLEGKDIDIVYLGDDEWPEPDYDEQKAVAESEDERIRKEIVSIVQSYRDSCISEGTHRFDDCLAWLEKQKDLDKMIVISPEVWDNAITDAYENGKRDSEKQKEQKPVDEKIEMKEFEQSVYDLCPVLGIEEAKATASDLLELAKKTLLKTGKVVLASNYPEGCSFEDGFHLGYNEGFNAKQEQKPAESISQPTVQGKGVYKICPRCKERMVRDDSMVYTSMPPQYRYECPKCGESECDTVMYDNPEMEEQKPANE